MDIIDISKWPLLEDREASGTREKAWYKDINNEKNTYLFKQPKSSGEVWAEKIACEIGNLLFDIPVAEYQIAQKNIDIGVISKNVVDVGKNEELYEVSDLLTMTDNDFDPKDLYQYNIEMAIKIGNDYSILNFFFDMCIFDFIIANQDRHCENWGILRKEGYIFPAPLYDNGSSLGNNLSEEKIQIYLGKDLNAFKAFNNRTRTLFTIENSKRPKAKSLMNYLYEYDKLLFLNSSQKFININFLKLNDIVESIPCAIMSENQKKFVSKLLLYRINMIKQFVDEGGKWHD